MPSLRPILRMPSPLAFNSSIRASTDAPAEFRPVRPCASETCVHPLSDNSPLKLSKFTQHLKHRLAGSRRGIESLLVKEQADSLAPQKHLALPHRWCLERG